MPENQGSEQQLLELMTSFRKAYSRGDRDGLLAVTTEDFQWHQHVGRDSSDQPTGRILHGVDELLTEVGWRQEHWREVRYENLQERSAGDLLVQTFVVSGLEDGVAFHARAVDLYPVTDGRISRKDTYWKYLK